MRIILHGAAKEIGRSCVEIISKDYIRILLDAGIKLSEQGTEYPVKIKNLSEIDAVFASHAHLDHTGALAYFNHQGLKCPIYMTKMTRELTKLLLKDEYKIGRLNHADLGFFEEDIEKVINDIKNIKLRKEGTIKGIKWKFLDAGHIPGSTSIKLNIDGKNILYTGDLNTNETQLLKPANTDYGDIDILIIEATYGNRDHPLRQTTENLFLKEIRTTLGRGGSVIIPAFAVGRAQEIMLLLMQLKTKVPIYLDGMAKQALDLFLKNPNCVKDAGALRKAAKRIKLVKGRRQRAGIVKRQGIFITTSGMLTGGPIIDYLKYLNDPKNKILLTGYQAVGTNGRILMEKGYVYLNNWKTNIKCQYKQFDFSAHSGAADLKRLIRKTNPSHLIMNHGDADAIAELAEWAVSLDYKVHAPNLCDGINL